MLAKNDDFARRRYHKGGRHWRRGLASHSRPRDRLCFRGDGGAVGAIVDAVPIHALTRENFDRAFGVEVDRAAICGIYTVQWERDILGHDRQD